MLKVQDKPFTNIEDKTKVNMVTQNVVVCTSLPVEINLCGHTVVGLRILCSLNLQLCYAFMLALCCDYAFNLCNYAQLCSTKVS